MSSIDALEWLFLIIAPTEWDCPSVFLKTLLRSASCFPWGGFNMDSFFMGLHHDLRCILLSLLFSCALSLFKLGGGWISSPVYSAPLPGNPERAA